MDVQDIVRMQRRHPIEVIGEASMTSVKETIGSLVLWGIGTYATIYLARWYTLRTLREKGVLPP